MGYGIIILLSVVSAAIMAVMISALGEELFLRLTILGLIGFSLYHLCTAEKKIMQQPIESSTKKRNSNNTSIATKINGALFIHWLSFKNLEKEIEYFNILNAIKNTLRLSLYGLPVLLLILKKLMFCRRRYQMIKKKTA